VTVNEENSALPCPAVGPRVAPSHHLLAEAHRSLPGAMQVDPRLMVRPQSACHAAAATRGSFFSARSEYLSNRVRAASSLGVASLPC
jgi:hypothetical protein